MFQKKSATNKKAGSKDAPTSNDAVTKKVILEELQKQPVHTMKSDLDGLYFENGTPDGATQKIASSNSPFAVQKETAITEEIVQPKENGALSKIIVSLIVVLVIILLLGTGYYFWATRIKNAANSSQEAENQLANSVTNKATEKPAANAFSEKQANYLSLDLSETTINQKKTLQEYAARVSQMETAVPIQFIVTDTLNNPVSLSAFAQKIGLNFPPAVSTQLGNTFSLYIYKDNSQPHFGLSITSKNIAALKTATEQSENGLFQALKPLFPENSITDTTLATFKPSLYKEYSVRYANLPTTTGFSIDYSLAKDQLIIGTSQMTTRSIIDTLAEVPAQPAM